MIRLLHGDCIEKMGEMEDNSVDSIVTDPSYGLGFMGKKWDALPPGVEVFKECLRVLKPGGHLLAFGGSRTYHRLACAVEDAGFEIRDQIMWIYGSGFPKSQNISKQIDKKAGAEREVVDKKYRVGDHPKAIDKYGWKESGGQSSAMNTKAKDIYETAPATEAAQQWEGWGTALKPAHEPIVMARKPLQGTVAQNVLEWGTGAVNVDGCRVETDESTVRSCNGAGRSSSYDLAQYGSKRTNGGHPSGRFPANVILDDSEEVQEMFPVTSRGKPGIKYQGNNGAAYGAESRPPGTQMEGFADSGSAARFFYCAKASKHDRTEGGKVDNKHPTVKPTDLMRYLCRMVTPKGGTVLDPFCGSGTTGKAAKLEGFGFVGIDSDKESIDIAKQRIEGTQKRERLALQ